VELLLQILLFGVLGIVAVSLITILALWRTLRRRLRVDPRVRSVAPTHWHLGQHKAARAHRRLRMASQSARQSTSGKALKLDRKGASEFPALAQSIVDQAVITERELVQAVRMPRPNRAAALVAPLNEVDRIEATVAELVSTRAAWRNAIDQQRHDPLDEVHDRLTNLRHASEGVRSAETTRTIAPSPSTSTSPVTALPQAVTPTSATQFSQSSVDNYVVETE
jgi:hypothetical protein